MLQNLSNAQARTSVPLCLLHQGEKSWKKTAKYFSLEGSHNLNMIETGKNGANSAGSRP